MKNSVILLILIALTTVSCNSVKTSNKNDSSQMQSKNKITNNTWKLLKLDGKYIPSDMDRDINFTLEKGSNKISGFAGCNTFMGNFSLKEGNRIHFSEMASTKMACPEAAVNENEVLKVFELANNYSISGDTLMLNIGKRAPLAVFVKSDENVTQITEKYWKLKVLEGKDVIMAENQEKESYFILKKEDNRVIGFSGCNSFSGNYTLEEGNRIRFSQMASTLKACPDLDVDETEFLKVFELADNYTINGDTLMLNVGKRAPLAVFETVYFE